MISGRSATDGPRGWWRRMRNGKNSIPGRQNSLRKGMVVVSHEKFFLSAEVEGMVDSQKQGLQRRPAWGAGRGMYPDPR